jgi:hypothetical protein
MLYDFTVGDLMAVFEEGLKAKAPEIPSEGKSLNGIIKDVITSSLILKDLVASLGVTDEALEAYGFDLIAQMAGIYFYKDEDADSAFVGSDIVTSGTMIYSPLPLEFLVNFLAENNKELQSFTISDLLKATGKSFPAGGNVTLDDLLGSVFGDVFGNGDLMNYGLLSLLNISLYKDTDGTEFSGTDIITSETEIWCFMPLDELLENFF